LTKEQATKELLDQLERSGIPAQMAYHNKINRVMTEFHEGRARDDVRRMAQEIDRLREQNARLVDMHNELADELNRVHPDRILYGRIPVKDELYFG
jgi:polyhydroxyalkanoate synthesis regulator phasin